MDTMTEQRLVAGVFSYLCTSHHVQSVHVHVKYTMYLREWVMTVGEAGTYTKHKFFPQNAKPFCSVGSLMLFDIRT